MSPHNMANVGPLAAEICLSVWDTPANFNGFRVLPYCSDVAHRRPTKLCTMFRHLLCRHIMYTFRRLLPADGILPGAKFNLRPSRAFSYIGSVTARHTSSGRQPTLRRGIRNGITELSQRTPPIFGWAAITLDIGPHHVLVHLFPHRPLCTE